MPSPVNQFYYVDQGRPILKTEYDDGSEDFYDASGQFSGYSWGHVGDGTVIDPYADLAQQEADRQQQSAVQNRDPMGDLGRSFNQGNRGSGGSYAMPTPFQPQNRRSAEDEREGQNWARSGSGQTSNMQRDGGSTMQTQQPPPGPPGGQAPDPRQGVLMDRYDWAGNPRQAMMNAMADVGGFQLTNNPYVDRLLSAAPALATAFMGQRAINPTMGSQAGANLPGSYADFGQYLQNALRSGNIFSTVQGAQSLFPQITNAVRAYNQAGSAGAAPNQSILENPFLRVLASQFGQNNNQGALQLYGQMFSPFMTGAQQRPFADMMDARYTNAAQQWFGQGNPAQPGSGGNDWWKFLFGY